MATTRTTKPAALRLRPARPAHSAPSILLADIVAETLPEPKRDDEFTLTEFMETAARMARPTAKRTALESLGRRVAAGEYETRMVSVNGHFARVWRRKIKTN